MERALIGRLMMGIGVLLVAVGLVTTLAGGSDSPEPVSQTSIRTETSAEPTTTTTAAATTTIAATTVTSTVAPTTTTQAETAEEFLAAFNVAFDTGDARFLLARLNEAAIERYGPDQCAAYLAGILPQSQGLSLMSIVGSGPWEYMTDNVTTSLAGITAVEVDRVVNGETRINELHWQLVRGEFTWFTDCGSPVIID